MVDGEEVHLIGGQIFKHPKNFRLRLTNAIQSYDVAGNRWRISGHLPYRLKIPVCALHKGMITVATGQRDQSSMDDSPGAITAATWRAPLGLLKQGAAAAAAPSAYAGLAGKEIVLISHELTLTGAPLLFIETAREMMKAGAIVRLFTLADDARYGNPAEAGQHPRAASRDLLQVGKTGRIGDRQYCGCGQLGFAVPSALSRKQIKARLVGA